MLFDSLTSETFNALIIGIVVCSIFYALAMDAILGARSLGVIPTAALTAITGYGALRGMDWAVMHHRIPVTYASPVGYVGAAAIGVTLVLVVGCLLKRFVVR